MHRMILDDIMGLLGNHMLGRIRIYLSMLGSWQGIMIDLCLFTSISVYMYRCIYVRIINIQYSDNKF